MTAVTPRKEKKEKIIENEINWSIFYLGVGGLAAPAGEALPELLLQLLRRDVQVELEGRALVLTGDNDSLETCNTTT